MKRNKEDKRETRPRSIFAAKVSYTSTPKNKPPPQLNRNDIKEITQEKQLHKIIKNRNLFLLIHSKFSISLFT